LLLLVLSSLVMMLFNSDCVTVEVLLLAVGNIWHCQSCPNDITACIFLRWTFWWSDRLCFAAESWKQFSDIPV